MSYARGTKQTIAEPRHNVKDFFRAKPNFFASLFGAPPQAYVASSARTSE